MKIKAYKVIKKLPESEVGDILIMEYSCGNQHCLKYPNSIKSTIYYVKNITNFDEYFKLIYLIEK